MSRPALPDKLLSDVESLITSGWTVEKACRKVGISRSTYYARRAILNSQRFPVIKQDWQALTASYEPKRFSRLKPRDRITLAKDVGEAFQKIFSRPGPILTHKQKAARLRLISKRIASLLEAFDTQDPETINEIASLAENPRLKGPINTVIEELRAYLPEINDREGDLAAAHGMDFRDKGGPLTDSRIASVVVRLADTYAQYKRNVPTHRTSPDTGLPVSPFNRFVRHAFKHFLSNYEFPDHALRVAMRHASARLDWQDEAAGKERDWPEINSD